MVDLSGMILVVAADIFVAIVGIAVVFIMVDLSVVILAVAVEVFVAIVLEYGCGSFLFLAHSSCTCEVSAG